MLDKEEKRRKLKPMTKEEVKKYCDNLLDQYGVPQEIRNKKISDEEFQKLMNKLCRDGSLSDEIIKMREESRRNIS